MGLNANNVPMSSNRTKQPLIEIGSYPTRVVQIVDLGMQPQSYEGTEKAPAREVLVGYEFVDEFMKDEDGNDVPEKPRWLSERFALKNLKVDKATSTKRYVAIDPTGSAKGDFTKLATYPCIVNVIKGKSRKGEDSNKIGSVSSVRAKDADKIPPLVNEPIIFLTDDPDMEVFNNFPDWIKEVITTNLEFRGSPLDIALNGSKASPAQDDAEEADDESWRE